MPVFLDMYPIDMNKLVNPSEFPNVAFENASIWVDVANGLTPIATARYGAVRKLAREIAALI